MRLAVTYVAWRLTGDLLAVNGGTGGYREWLSKFLLAFIPAFFGTGVLLGAAYVLVMRAIRADRAEVEAWFEEQRLRLQSGPVPIIERAQPVMLGGLYAIYGRTPLRRLLASFIIAVLFTSATFVVVYSRYTRIPPSVREKKGQFEREIDPVLYRYITDRQLKTVYEKSKETTTIQAGEARITVNVYNGGIYDDLRRRDSDFQLNFVKGLYASPDRIDLTLLFLFEGSYYDPGFQWINSACLFAFNVLLDFVSVTMLILCLQRLGSTLTLRSAVVLFLLALMGTYICATIAFLSYRLFFRGDTRVFLQLVVFFPLELALLAYAGGYAIGHFRPIWKNEKASSFWWAMFGALFGIGLITDEVLPYWRAASLGVVGWHDMFSFPYVLSVTTLVPATLTLVMFGLMLLTKFTTEPARVLPEAYMTFIKEEVGGRQAAGIIILISIAAGCAFGLLWPA